MLPPVPKSVPEKDNLPARRDVAAWVGQSRERQGLPPKVENLAVLAKVAHLLLSRDSR